MIKPFGYLRRLAFVATLLAFGDLHGAEKIRVSGGGITPLHSLIWVANQEGLFKKYGMDVEYLVMNSGTLGVQTLLSNDSQFLFSTVFKSDGTEHSRRVKAQWLHRQGAQISPCHTT